MPTPSLPVIAYLAPEMPALSETFVYEEIYAVERRGYRVIPFCLRLPEAPARDQVELLRRVRVLYGGSMLWQIFNGLAHLPFMGSGAILALRYLVSDIWECSPHRTTAAKLTYQFIIAIRLAQMLKQEKCDHLHVHFAHTSAQVAMYAAAMTGVPFSIMAHANDIFERALLLRRKSERAVRMLTISEHNRRYLESFGITKEKLAVVRCGVSFKVNLKVSPAGGRGPFTIGTLGRLIEKKGFSVLIRAVAVLAQCGHALVLRIVGEGPRKLHLERLVRRLGIAGIVSFEGALPHAQVAGWMQGLDVFALACRMDSNGDMDGIPLVLMEAMSQSIPVISTRLSGIPELIVHQETGLLAEPDDMHDLARQIWRLIESADLRARLAAGALRHVVDEFGPPKNIDRLIGYLGLQDLEQEFEPNRGGVRE